MDDEDEIPDMPEIDVSASRDESPMLNEDRPLFRSILNKGMETDDLSSGYDVLLRKQQAAANAKRAALLEARKSLLARRHDDSMGWLSFAAGMGAPTRTGSFFESLSNANQQLVPQLQKKQDWENEKQDKLSAYGQAIGEMGGEEGDAFDENVMAQKLALIKLQMSGRQNLAGRALTALSKGPTAGSQPEIIKLQTQLESLPEGDPRRKPLEDRINKLNYIAPKTDPNAIYEPNEDDTKAADAIGTYQSSPASILGRMSGARRVAIMDLVYSKYPNYGESGFKSLNDTVSNYNNMAPGRPGAQLVSYNTVINHLDTLRELATKTQNGQLQGANAVKNWLSTKVGGPDVTNLQGSLMLVAPELAKAVAGSQTGVDERGALERIMGAANSQEQFAGLLGDPKLGRAIVGVLPSLLAGKMSEMRRGFYAGIPEEAMPRYKGWFEKKLSPGTTRMLRQLRVEGFTDPVPSPAAAAPGSAQKKHAQYFDP